MLYHLYDLQHAILTPARLGAELLRTSFQNPMNPLAYSPVGRTIAAGAEVFERITRRFGKPSFDLPTTKIGKETVTINSKVKPAA